MAKFIKASSTDMPESIKHVTLAGDTYQGQVEIRNGDKGTTLHYYLVERPNLGPIIFIVEKDYQGHSADSDSDSGEEHIDQIMSVFTRMLGTDFSLHTRPYMSYFWITPM